VIDSQYEAASKDFRHRTLPLEKFPTRYITPGDIPLDFE